MSLNLVEKVLKGGKVNEGTKAILLKFKQMLTNNQTLTINQTELLRKICRDSGIALDESKPLELVEIKGTCGKCRDGLVLAYDKDAALYVFICPCDVGARRPEQYPNWRNYESTNTYRIDKPGTNPRFDEPWKKL